MCGIAGILNHQKTAPVEGKLLERMSEVIHHRGPDDGGIELMDRVGFAHRRLSIIDLAGGHQPMLSTDGRLCLTYNGEIYNYRALRAQLQTQGYMFRTDSDTEVILCAYQAFGEQCVEHLQGMFAFAIWDKDRQSLFMARDRLGIKPLYFADVNGQLVFASEIKSLLASGLLSAEMNSSVLPEFLGNRFVSGDTTFYKNVHKLMPGHTLRWQAESGFRQHCYWTPPVPDAKGQTSMAECVERVRDQLQATVDSHLMSDVPVGVFLSGGIDSSVLAAMAARTLNDPVKTFSVGFRERAANELEYARLVATDIKADHHEVVVSPEEFFSELPRLVWHEDEPIAHTSSIPLYFVSRLARDHVKVVLTGEGADELFLGYNRYRLTYWNQRLGRLYQNALPGSVRGTVRKLTGRLPGKFRRYSERSFLSRSNAIRDIYYDNFSVFSLPQIDELLASGPDRESWPDPYAVAVKCYEAANAGILESLSYADLQTYLVELLMKQDQMSMAASIESRVPFLDHKFVEMVARIPSQFKLRGTQTKAVLREAVKGLIPEQILKRPKMGFPVPIADWLRSDYSYLLDEFVNSTQAKDRSLFKPETLDKLVNEHRAGTSNHAERLWLLINLEIWQRVFIDGTESAAVMPGFAEKQRMAA